jgi:hypothetical protein
LIDVEADGQPSAIADADDNNNLDDEDGVTPPAQLTLGATATFQVTASTDGFLDAWIDFDGDGSFDEPGDRIFTSEPLVAGVNTLQVPVPMDPPAGVVLGAEVFARFRFSLAGGMGPTGLAPNGEVEDYGIKIVAPPPPDGGGGGGGDPVGFG